MTNLIICVVMFYILHLFLVMSFSLHKVPFIQWTYTGGDISGKTALSERMTSKITDNTAKTMNIGRDCLKLSPAEAILSDKAVLPDISPPVYVH